MGKGVQQQLKQKIFSRVVLNASTSFRFFNETDTPSIFGNIDAPSKIDENSLFEVEKVNLYVMRSNGAPANAATLAIVSAMISDTFFQIKQNTTTEIISFHTGTVLAYPMEVAAAGAAAYNPAAIFTGSFTMDILWKIYGGQNISVVMQNPTAVDLTGIDLIVELEGNIDRSQNVDVEG